MVYEGAREAGSRKSREDSLAVEEELIPLPTGPRPVTRT